MIARYLASLIGLAVATWLLPGITMADGSLTQKVLILAVVAVIFSLVNALAKPVLKVLSLPLVLLTLGLFLLIINAAMMLLTSWLAGAFGVSWHVADLLNAIGGSVVVSLVSMVALKLFGEDEKKRDRR
ncbi:phage holin family protein [Enemella sp. A6]|uniref:phage holin family protein n=1 Tax=Enemella sp. A6 TaxID=3440152 RepID=UPI003EC10374